MTFLDKYLQRWRMNKALPFIPIKSHLLDIGCFKGELLLAAQHKLAFGLGIDPLADDKVLSEKLQCVKGNFPAHVPVGLSFHAITALAVFEHIPTTEQPGFLKACSNFLKPGGFLIISVPDAKVDALLNILTRIKLVKGMSLEEHYGFEVASLIPMAKNVGFELHTHQKFQLGLNNLFVFKKPNEA